VLVARHLPKLGAHLVTALTRLNAHNLVRRSNLEADYTQEKKGERRGECKEVRVAVWHGKQEIPVARSIDPERENEVVLPHQPPELWAPRKARWVWAGAVAKYLFW
jgi:hypothetical protein